LQAVGGIIYNSLVIFGTIFLGKTIDAANLVYNNEAPLSFFYFYILFFIGLSIILQVARYLKRYYMRMICNLINCDIRAGLLSALFQMPMVELSQEKVGDMMSRMIGDVEQVGESVRTTITETWDTVILMISHFIACMIYSPEITLLASIPIPIVVIVAQLIRHPLYRLSQKSRRAASNINVHLQHNVSGIALLRLFGLEKTNRRRFSALLDEQLKWNIVYTALQGSVLPFYILLATCGIVLVVGMGGGKVIGGDWTIGMFTAYLSMFTAMAVRTNVVGRVMNTWHGAKASWDRICEKLQYNTSGEVTVSEIAVSEAAVSEAAVSEAVVSEEQKYTIGKDKDIMLEVNSLSFKYPFSNEAYLTDISFTVRCGEIIGVTGPVGSGKSALAAALSGLYPYTGEIKTNGSVAYMDSEHFIFSDDVLFNVTLDRDGGNLEESLELSSMTEDIKTFEHGTNTRLMERGVRISGGQRQRISLARVWYGSSDILLLDDPFSAIDITMEHEIMQNIRSGLKNRAVIIFSHRLSAFDLTDKVFVLDKGCISQAGTHEELVNNTGLYREIYYAQKFMRGGERT
jgi:ABC-type multidrug transport system fused ATPase/permease subunit